ncbi:hypothetical protein OAO01_04470 [Oligoflexia bacterium]|nr:hypothetical protein [Oligoflexia bacterium]
MWQGIFYTLGRMSRVADRSRLLKVAQACMRVKLPEGKGDNLDWNKLLKEFSDVNAERLSKAAVAGMVETVQALLNRPSVRASLEAVVLKTLGDVDHGLQPPAAVREQADLIADILKQKGIIPERIGVDGLPGSGKSTLSRALATRLGLKWRSLDHENMNAQQDFAQQHTIYEHQRLFRTQNIDAFDVIVYVDEPVKVAMDRVMQRATEEGREALIIDVLDYDKLKQVGKLAFDICEGETVSIPNSNLRLKLRASEGFGAEKNIIKRLQASGYDTEGFNKEELLFLSLYGSAQSGLLAYFQPEAFSGELLVGLRAGLERYLEE